MYDLIAANKRNSLILLFLVSLLLLAVGGVFAAALGGAPEAGLVVASGVAILLWLISWYGGRGLILSMSGARKIEHAENPLLHNVVEEMAIAAGLPTPDVYLIESSAPNAFATGRDPRHAAVAITRGLLEKLDRDELQGVMAHEMAHIRNFDIRFAMLMAILVGAIALLCDAFLRHVFRGRMLRSGRRGGGRGGGGAAAAMAVIFVLAMVLAILAPLAAKIIQMAVSREREYLADATAAELTRYPDGLARALEKIEGHRAPMESANRATQHLYIVNPLKRFHEGSSALFSTHPATNLRIARLRSIGAAAPTPGAASQA